MKIPDTQNKRRHAENGSHRPLIELHEIRERKVGERERPNLFHAELL